ncbi:hypothetical protein RIF29_39083 [Crotalaria pallida]|uniref:Uncharacterized protein n=1 Tax=Crotalaria pallida TaxID=3830 RepID=A0AAN9E0G4_CROPI
MTTSVTSPKALGSSLTTLSRFVNGSQTSNLTSYEFIRSTQASVTFSPPHEDSEIEVSLLEQCKPRADLASIPRFLGNLSSFVPPQARSARSSLSEASAFAAGKRVSKRTLSGQANFKIIKRGHKSSCQFEAMKFLFQCPCCSCFCFMKPKKGKAKVKEDKVKEVKEAKEEKIEEKKD